eukprot:s471_g9.t3
MMYEILEVSNSFDHAGLNLEAGTSGSWIELKSYARDLLKQRMLTISSNQASVCSFAVDDEQPKRCCCPGRTSSSNSSSSSRAVCSLPASVFPAEAQMKKMKPEQRVLLPVRLVLDWFSDHLHVPFAPGPAAQAQQSSRHFWFGCGRPPWQQDRCCNWTYCVPRLFSLPLGYFCELGLLLDGDLLKAARAADHWLMDQPYVLQCIFHHGWPRPKSPALLHTLPFDQCDMFVSQRDGLLRTFRDATATSSRSLRMDSYAPVASVPAMSSRNTTRSEFMKMDEEEWHMASLSNTPHKLVERSESYELARQESTRIHRKEKASGMTLQEVEEEPMRPSLRELARRVANSLAFELFFAVVIIANAFYLGIQLQWEKESRAAGLGAESLTVQLIFAVLFSIEVSIRIMGASSCRNYICGRDRLWNWLDVFVVSTSWLVIGLEVLVTAGMNEANSTNLRVFRVFKVSRLLRVVASLWVVRSVKALRQLVNSLVDTLMSLFWALVLLLLIIYTFGILFTDAAIDYALYNEPDPMMEAHFGTLYQSLTTLLRSILGGIDWWIAADSLQHIGMFWVQVFNFYVCFCTFAVLNVMTGVVCKTTASSGS